MNIAVQMFRDEQSAAKLSCCILLSLGFRTPLTTGSDRDLTANTVDPSIQVPVAAAISADLRRDMCWTTTLSNTRF